ncbi:MAG: hypothetical protein ACRD8Z_15190, partial [Nitrososphaeraceae archaeon]
MKKRPIDKIPEEVKGKQKTEKEQMKEEQENDTFTSINCNFCEEFAALPLPPTPSTYSIRKKGTGWGKPVKVIGCDHDREDHEYNGYDKQKHRKLFNNTKILIVIGLVATVPIVFLELLLADSLLNISIILGLATLVQILLGRPFYMRFFRALTSRRRLTTDTLVILSTLVAYFYSITNMLIGSNLQFFEASSSVLTIFTIGEYLETRVLRTTSESLRNLLALKPKYAVIIRDGRQREINSDEVAIGDIVITKPGEKIATDG